MMSWRENVRIETCGDMEKSFKRRVAMPPGACEGSCESGCLITGISPVQV
jgi:hypothetical protein